LNQFSNQKLDGSLGYSILNQTQSIVKCQNQGFSNLDEFSPLSDFENAIQDSLTEVSGLLHELKHKKIRLNKVRAQYNAGLINQLELESIWKKWHSEIDVLVLQNDDGKSIGMKCSKRGNDVYRYRIKERFREIDYLASDLDFDVFNPNDKDKTTNGLFFTLTYDTKRCTKSEAWQNIGIEYNRFVSHIKRKYGNVTIIRCFESFANGYPHIHAVALFESSNFDVFEHYPTNDIMQGSTYRIKEKRSFESSWHSNIDVLAINNMGRAINYITKYLRKTNNEDSPKYATTQSLLWIHNKRSFSISGKFKKELEAYRLESKLHNSNKKLCQLDLSGDIIPENWHFVGIFSLRELQTCNKIRDVKAWNFEIDKIPDKERQNADSEDDKINRKLYAANKGVIYSNDL